MTGIDKESLGRNLSEFSLKLSSLAQRLLYLSSVGTLPTAGPWGL